MRVTNSCVNFRAPNLHVIRARYWRAIPPRFVHLCEIHTARSEAAKEQKNEARRDRERRRGKIKKKRQSRVSLRCWPHPWTRAQVFWSLSGLSRFQTRALLFASSPSDSSSRVPWQGTRWKLGLFSNRFTRADSRADFRRARDDGHKEHP